MSIQSNTVLITGASRGLGANFSRVLAHDGFKIIGVGRNIKNLKSVISSLPNQDLGHSYLELNITDELQGISIKVESKPKSFVTSKIGLLKEPASSHT